MPTGPRRLPGWVPGRVFYQLHSLGASGVPATNPGTAAAAGAGLDVLRRWLDHVAALGAGGVLLTPVAVSSTHGYDTVDPLHLDPRLGDDAAMDVFVADCHDRDLRVVLDGVFNHVGRHFPAFADVVTHRGDSPWAAWFRLHPGGDDGDGFGYDCFEGHRELPTLAHDNPAVVDWATTVARHWLDRGADGWRLDAAYAIPPHFVAEVVGRVKDSHPDAFVFGEVIHGDYARIVEASGLDSVTQYELYKATWSSLHDANFFELAWALDRHRQFCATFAPVTFTGNHDVTRLASQLPGPALAGLATAVLCTVPGVPCVYYGDELGWTGRKEQRAGGDDAIRPPLPADATPAGEAAAAVLDAHRRLIGLRRARPWLTDADVEVTDVANRRLAYEVTGDGGRLRVHLDIDLGHPDLPGGWSEAERGPGWVVGTRS